MTDEQLVANVAEAVAEYGFWTDWKELAMGSGLDARIDLTEAEGAAAYRVTGGRGITIQGTYRTLERALDMAALFSSLVWEIAVATWQDPDLIVPSADETAP